VQIGHAPGEAGRRLVERVYPLVAEGIAGGLYLPNRNSNVCNRRLRVCRCVRREFGGCVE
jgi:hypothetical protein